ncbi:T9SS type A sorting domain-containing protein, partial [Flammeovirga sp. OC4]|uniref:T9SS type A sorting domain-containing protein n=1 Tax=Flammeovirga sp. OC4 TaxID=1382345 RepID=UPI0005C44B32
WSAPSTDASLSVLKVDDVAVEGFDGSTLDYTITYAYGTEGSPKLSAETTDANATFEIKDSDIEGAATVVVTAQDGTTELTYTVNYVWSAPSTDASLSVLKVDDVAVEGFDGSTLDYTITYAYGTEGSPKLSAETADANATFEIMDSDIEGAATVVVTAQDGTTELTYTVNYVWSAPSTDATLSEIALDGVLLDGFSSDQFSYTVAAAELPTATVITTDENAKAEIIPIDAFGGVIEIVVTAQDGITKQTYTITVTQSTPTSVEDFNAKVNIYTFNKSLIVNSEEMLDGSVLQVINIHGQLIHKQSLNGFKAEVSNLPQGVLIILVGNEDGILRKKVVIE